MIPYGYFIHPEDQKAFNAMKSIPGFDMIVKESLSDGWEAMLHGVNMASCIRLSEKQLPEIYGRVTRICDRLGMDYPEVYLSMSPYPNALTYGGTTVYLILTSALFSCLEDDEIDSVIAHECGHILCHHVLYHTVANVLSRGICRIFPKISEPIRLAMYHWGRMSELSADRAAALICGVDTVVRTQLRLSGGPKELTKDVDIREWARQGEEYDELCSGNIWNRFLQGFSTMDETHPFSAVRVREVMDWAGSKEFETVKAIEEGRIRVCPNCHYPVSDDWRYCRYCGEKLS